MMLWIEWMKAVAHLRPACARRRTYAWMVLVLMGLSIRLDLAAHSGHRDRSIRGIVISCSG